jgi:hypothetical protein
MPVRILCASAELAVECLEGAGRIGLAVEPEVHADPIACVAGIRGPIAIALVEAPSLDRLVELAHAREASGGALLLAVLERSLQAERLRQVALDLGITALAEIGPLIAAVRMADAAIEHPWAASLRALSEPDRARLRGAQASGARSGAHFVALGAGRIAFAAQGATANVELGSAVDAAAAISALRETDRESPRIEASVEGVDHKAVLDVLFGPRRALSDPASKLALQPYGIPVPMEELCGSASRAAAEAGRIGFPVRISLASPDLRVWDHADLSVDMVDNAARVRDTFRQLMGLAKARLPGAGASASDLPERVLGVMVTATSESVALLGARSWSLPEGRVAMELAFADPHGAAADDRTLLLMPAELPAIERAIKRLAGSALVLGSARAQRKVYLEAIADVLQRLCAFVHDRRREITQVELRPIALLLDGSVEVREACVTVSDAFERMLNAAPIARPA